MKSRLRTPTCGAARPTPSARSIVSYMPWTSGTRSPVISSTSRARCFSTGSPKSRSGYMPPSYPLSFTTRRGSTSTRKPPVGTGGVDAGRRQRVAQVGDRRGAQERPPSRGPGRPDRAPSRRRSAAAAHAARDRVGGRPLTSARPPNGGKPSAWRRARSASATSIGLARRTARTTSCSGSRVWSEQAAPVAAAARAAGRRTRSQSACSAARTRGASSSWSSSRNATRPTAARRHPVEHRLGADQHGRVGHLVGGGVDHADLGARQQRGEVVAHACATPGRTARNVRGVAVQADHRARRSRSARTRAPASRLARRSRRSARSGRARAAAAREEPGPPVRFSTHTARAPRSTRVVQRVGERRAEQAVPGRLVALVDDLDQRPAGAVDATVGSPRSPTDRRRPSGPG